MKKYCKLEKPAYDYFYNIEINKKPLIENIRKLYNINNIQEFMIKGLENTRGQVLNYYLVWL
ncbi:hypothetical protein [Clostridium tepidiprofundi]|uniref:hypothetical protein n=1 Tax=Clostridium tepidiprofundi TaxID=420412 RepID=UPI00082D94BB|nr:hypothetical protein [Clostridium tepidiprofundi]